MIRVKVDLNAPSALALLGRMDREGWHPDRPSAECRGAIKMPRLLARFDEIPRRTLHWFWIYGVHGRRFLRGTAQSLGDETKVLWISSLFHAFERSMTEEQLRAVRDWHEGDFRAESRRFFGGLARLVADEHGCYDFSQFDATPYPHVWAAFLLDSFHGAIPDDECERFYENPALAQESVFRHGSVMNERGRQFIFDMKRFEHGVRLHDRSMPWSSFFEGDTLAHPESFNAWFKVLTAKHDLHVFTSRGVEVGDLLVKSAFDGEFGRRSRSQVTVAPFSDLVEDGTYEPEGPTASPDVYAATSEAREAASDPKLRAALEDVLDAIDSFAETDPERGAELAAEVVRLVSLVAAQPDPAMRAAILFGWARRGSYRGALSLKRLAKTFGESVPTIERRGPRARRILQEAGLFRAA